MEVQRNMEELRLYITQTTARYLNQIDEILEKFREIEEQKNQFEAMVSLFDSMTAKLLSFDSLPFYTIPTEVKLQIQRIERAVAEACHQKDRLFGRFDPRVVSITISRMLISNVRNWQALSLERLESLKEILDSYERSIPSSNEYLEECMEDWRQRNLCQNVADCLKEIDTTFWVHAPAVRQHLRSQAGL